MSDRVPLMISQEAFNRAFEIVKKHLDAELADRDARIAALEAAPQLTDGGTWDAQKVFKPGQVVTHDGSAWVCKETSLGVRPGTSNAFRLLVKRGRDAKGS